MDEYQSVIWTERYFEAGDCELYCAATEKNIAMMQAGNFLTMAVGKTLCRIVKVETITDTNKGNWLLVTGKDARSILNQRVYTNATYTAVYAITTIKNIIEDNAGVDAATRRKISGLLVDYDPDIDPLPYDTYYTTDRFFYCFDKIVEICRKFGYGNRMIWSADKNLKFQLYIGADRSASITNTTNVPIIFSESNNNLASSDYLEDYTTFKNVAYTAGEGEGWERLVTNVNNTTYSGLDRYEMYVDGASVPRTPQQGTTLTDQEYAQVLQDYAGDALAEYGVAVEFSGTTTDYLYKFGTDYFLGDIVTVISPLGVSFDARITEVIESEDTQHGHIYIPKFEYLRQTLTGVIS